MKYFIKENWFKIGILVCLMLGAFTIYQSFVVLPKQASEKKELAEFLEKIELENKEGVKKINLDKCLADARANYNSNWMGSCKSLGKLSNYCLKITGDNGFDSYLESVGATGTTSIDSLVSFNKAVDECSCSLPNVTATRWDDISKEEEDRCYN